MDEQVRFRIIFEKVAEALASEGASAGAGLSSEVALEYEEIDELRRLSLELAEPEAVTYTLS